MLVGLKRLWRVVRWLWNYPRWEKVPLPPGVGVRPLTEGYRVKGGTNAFPSQITDRPPPPAPMTRPGTRCPECGGPVQSND